MKVETYLPPRSIGMASDDIALRRFKKSGSGTEIPSMFGRIISVNDNMTAEIRLETDFVIKNVLLPAMITSDPLQGFKKPPYEGCLCLLAFPVSTNRAVVVNYYPAIIDDRQSPFFQEGEGLQEKSINGPYTVLNDREGIIQITDEDGLEILLDKESKLAKITLWDKGEIELSEAKGFYVEANGNTMSFDSSKIVLNDNLEVLQ